ncbi:hypothetical protein L5515_011294 [Caenorhabditis briggsae]|uniref:HTH CENPB-type domain-containing protein n=1 Tax=Caenorhabditis briggsae TaxID=6238 RepID=A0AAE9JFA5_CAEBR|nr:hypothetical protein L5515_011294 [Caenorhabditis briggsae]
MSDDEKLNVFDVYDDEKPAKKQRLSYSNAFKSKVVEFSRRSTVSNAAKKFGVDRKCVRRWIHDVEKIQEEIESGNSEKLRFSGAGRHLNDLGFDEKLKKWVDHQQKNKVTISRKTIKIQAGFLSKQPSFKASSGWLQKFINRHNLSFQRG